MKAIPGWAQSLLVLILIAVITAILEAIPTLPISAAWWPYIVPIIVAALMALLAWLKSRQAEVGAAAVNMRSKWDRFLWG